MVRSLVSVIITCYNYGEYIGEAIESIVRQSYDNIELIIIDDGSTDNSLEVIQKNKKHATIISRPNKGIVHTRNEGLKVAKGDFICFLDADDYFDKDYIKNMVAIAQETHADVVYPNWHVFGDQEYRTEFAEFDIQKLIKQELHCTSESLLRAVALKGHKFENNKIAEDWDFFLGLALDGRKFILAKDIYINYRVRHGTRATTKTLWENMYDFYDILAKWEKKYPDVVRPLDLPIGCGIQRDDHISALKMNIEHLEKTIRTKDERISELRDETAQLNEAINDIYKSKRYRLTSLIMHPFVLLRGMGAARKRKDT